MAEAIDRARRAVGASRRDGTLTAEFIALHWLAGLLILDGQIEPGRAAALRAFELSRALGNVGLAGSIYQLALVLAVHGETDTAARLAGFAAGYADQHQLSRYEIAIAIRGRLVERLNSARRCSRRAVVRTRAPGHWAVMLRHYLGLADRMPDRQRLKTVLSLLDSVTS